MSEAAEDSDDEKLDEQIASVGLKFARLGQLCAKAVANARAPWPRYVYHYTTVEGMFGIVTSGCLWATHCEFLNDPLEAVFVQDAIHQFLRGKFDYEHGWYDSLRNIYSNFLVDGFEELRFKNESRLSADTRFCASFSQEFDDLSQFRVYCNDGNGVCLEFETSTLLETVNMHYGYRLFDMIKVQYGVEMLDLILEEIFEHARDMVIKVAERDDSVDDPVYLSYIVSENIHDFFTKFGMCFKQGGYHKEQEWRLMPIILPPLNEAQMASGVLVNKKVRLRGGVIVPYIELPITDKENRRISSLKSICIGPGDLTNLAESGIHHLFDSIGMSVGDDDSFDVRLRYSKTTHRSHR